MPSHLHDVLVIICAVFFGNRNDDGVEKDTRSLIQIPQAARSNSSKAKSKGMYRINQQQPRGPGQAMCRAGK